MSGETEEPRTVRFHYIKSPHFATIHVDGAIGGQTPQGAMHMALYSERAAIPQQTEFHLKQDNQLGDEVEGGQVTRGGIVREMQIDAIMSPQVAARICAWLYKHCTLLKVPVDLSEVGAPSEDDDNAA